MFTKSTVAALAALTALGFAATAPSAYAGNDTANFDTAAVKVSYADLNLSSQAGATVLLHRIHQVAKTICGEPGKDLILARSTEKCIHSTVDDAVASVNSPVLTAMNGDAARPGGLELANAAR